MKGSIFSYSGRVTNSENDTGNGKIPGFIYYKADGYYELQWASRAVVVVGAGV